MKHLTLSDTFTIHNNTKTYHFPTCLTYIEQQGKIRYGQKFKIDTLDYPTIYTLIIYAIQDQKEARRLNISLNRGILLCGKIGCGKTSLMHLIKPFMKPKNDYKLKTCREVSFEFAKNGFEALQAYTLKAPLQNRLSGYCFDDLGAEQQIKHFGNDCNVMAEILISRYEDFVFNNSITHITTNLSASEIESFYGNRLRSRMREMFNLVCFDNSSKDKR
ncbi:ATPase [Flavobacterium columnare]|uniref:ATPase n=1 Tax=Flavobacterium columnare TaxID=996 RepID=UPI003BA08AFD